MVLVQERDDGDVGDGQEDGYLGSQGLERIHPKNRKNGAW